jgi:cysteine desulfurase
MVYLDNAAAAPVAPEIMDAYRNHLTSCFANQEASHSLAYEIRRKLKDAEKRVSTALTGEPDHYVHWGSSGTALFNLICRYPGFTGQRLRTSNLEHPALTAALNRLGDQGNRSLIALHHVQSETGQINDLTSIDKGDAVFLADTVQSAGKLEIPWKTARPDLIFCSGHKIGAPGGALLICRDHAIREFLMEARQSAYLAERPEPALCLTLADALETACRNRVEHATGAARLKTKIIATLVGRQLSNGRKIRLTVPAEQSSPFILHLIIGGYQSAVLVRMLSRHNIHVGAGSACQAESKRPSPALLALGFNREDAYSGLRLSFWHNTEAEIDSFLQAFDAVLREY